MKLTFPFSLILGSCLLLLACGGTPESAPATPPPAATSSHTITAQTFKGLEVKPVQFTGRTFMGIRQKVPFAQVQSFYVKNMGTIFNACQSAGLEMDGMPSGLFYEYNEEEGFNDMAATIGVKQGQALGQGIEMITLPAARALQVDYYGNYQGISNAHYAIDEYLKTNKITQNLDIPVIEEYVTSPSAEPDPNKRLTRVTYFY